MAQGKNYAGDVSAKQAWDILKEEEGACLIDVRTRAEWMFVGVPDIEELGKQTLFVEWQNTQGQNSAFVDEVQRKLKERNTPAKTQLLFLCRSGQRSRAAAISCTEAGFTACYNIASGFEGDLDQDRHRGTLNGWRHGGLPWVQS
jgi:rhodanese-related sulfurtransferase